MSEDPHNTEEGSPHAGDARLDDLLLVLLAEAPPINLECSLIHVRLLAVLLLVRCGLE